MSAIQRDARGRFLPGNTISRRGAAATIERHRQRLSEWGKKGYRATVDRHFGGDREAANKWLAQKGMSVQDEQYSSWFYQAEDPGPHPAHISRTVLEDK